MRPQAHRVRPAVDRRARGVYLGQRRRGLNWERWMLVLVAIVALWGVAWFARTVAWHVVVGA